jgi:hypothetical protein
LGTILHTFGYRNKTTAGSRVVLNEAELLTALLRHLSPAYHLLVLRHTDSFGTIELLQVRHPLP